MLFQTFESLARRAASERGAVAAEYAFLLALITLALVGVMNGLTGGIVNTFQAVINTLP